MRLVGDGAEVGVDERDDLFDQSMLERGVGHDKSPPSPGSARSAWSAAARLRRERRVDQRGRSATAARSRATATAGPAGYGDNYWR